MPHTIRKVIVIFVGVSEDHQRVLCIKNGDALDLPRKEIPGGIHSEIVAEEIKETYIFDEITCRPMAFAYDTMSFPHHHGSIAIMTHAAVVDNRCWMIRPHTGIWIPHRQLLAAAQPTPVRKALLALQSKHHLV